MSKQKMKKRNKIILFIAIPILFILAAGVAYGYHIYSTTENVVEESYEEIGREDETSDLREEAVDPIEDNVSVLIIGVDDSDRRGYNGKSRSDTLILATFNKESGDVKLLSIPRDTYTYIPEVGYYSKINHAHFFGGPKAAVEAVESLLNVPVDYFVRVNFDAFIELVDSLGGIYYNVPYEISELNSKDKLDAIKLSPGYQKLDGEEALAVARTRKYDSDIQRGERQQELIKSIVRRAKSASTVFKLESIIRSVGKNITTNITFDEMKSFISYAMDSDFSIKSVTLEGEGAYLDDGLWYYVLDEEKKLAVSKELREHLDLPAVQETETQLSTGETDTYMNSY